MPDSDAPEITRQSAEHWFICDDYELRILEFDGPGGTVPTFVLVHGIGVSSLYMAPLAEKLAAHGRVLLMDLPGFGGVPQPEDDLDVEGFARVIRSGLEALKASRVVLIGHSMGAQFVVELALLAPEFGGRVVLVAPVVPPGSRDTRTVLADFIRSSFSERLPAAMLSVQGYLQTAPSWVAAVFPAMLEYRIERRIEGLKGRLAILRGDEDVLCTDEWVDELARAARGCEVTTTLVEGASHQVVVDHADWVVAAALDVCETA